jgi:hypothetical protein
LGPGKASTHLTGGAKGPVKQLPASRLASHRLTNIRIYRRECESKQRRTPPIMIFRADV